MLPQRGVPSKISQGIRPGMARPSFGGPSKISPWSQRRPSQSLLSPKGVLGAKSGFGAKKAPSKKPTSLFGEKRYLSKLELRERIRKLSPFILRGKTIKKSERVKMVEQWFPYKKFGTHVKEGEARRALRGLRKKEHWAKPREKKSLKFSRKLLEAFTGVRKY